MPRRVSIARRLEEELGGRWRAVRDGFGWRYECSDGREVRRYAAPVLDYDGYSDTKFNSYYSADGGWTPVLVGLSTVLKLS